MLTYIYLTQDWFITDNNALYNLIDTPKLLPNYIRYETYNLTKH